MSQKKLLVDDKELPLTKAEYEICEFLAKNRGQVFSKEQILEEVFGFDSESNDSTIITHIKNIRAKFADYDYTPVSYTHLDVYKRQVYGLYDFFDGRTILVCF